MGTVITPANADTFIPEVWANRAIQLLDAELHLAKNVARDSEFTPTTVGKTVHIPKTGGLTANQKVAGTPVTLQNPSSDEVEVDIDQHWEVSFILDDVAKAQANQDVMDRYIQDAIVVLGEKIETSLAGLWDDLTGGVVNSGGGDIVDGDLLDARSKLTIARAPQRDRFLYLAPDQINEILEMTKFVNAEKYGSNTPVQEGEFGKIYGFKTFETVFAPEVGSPAITKNLAMHRNAMVLAMRPLPEPKAKGVTVAVVERNGILMRVLYSYNASELGDQVTIDTLFGVNVLRPELGVVIES